MTTTTLAKQIQKKLYENDEAKKWSKTHIFGANKSTGEWYKITFDHVVMNAFNAAIHFEKFLNRTNNSTVRTNSAIPTGLDIEKIDPLEIKDRYIGDQNIRAKEIIKDFYDMQQYTDSNFYIPIDLTHLSGEPCLLRYTFDTTKSFDQQWDQVRSIKKNENGYLTKNKRWMQFTSPHPAWVSFMRLDTDLQFYFAEYDYDRKNLQGLGIIITNRASYWTFSFFANPETKKYFISKYNLKKTKTEIV